MCSFLRLQVGHALWGCAIWLAFQRFMQDDLSQIALKVMQLFIFKDNYHKYQPEKSALTLYTLTSKCIFAILFSIHLLRSWKGEFVWKLRTLWLLIISLNLVAFMYDTGVTLWGEITCQSLLGVQGFKDDNCLYLIPTTVTCKLKRRQKLSTTCWERICGFTETKAGFYSRCLSDTICTHQEEELKGKQSSWHCGFFKGNIIYNFPELHPKPH